MLMDTVATDHLLSTTRSVRRKLDLDRPVEPQLIIESLRLAIQAPTGGNVQGWRWMVVTDPGKRAKLADLYRRADGGRFNRRSERARDSDPATSRVYASAAYLADVLDRVPVHVIPCLLGRVDLTSNLAASSFYGSIHPAVWSLMLALRSRGLGSAWTSLHLAYEAEAADILGIPADVTQVGLIPVAHTLTDEFKPARRAPAEEVTFWDEWGRGR
jgi:nitroreductase